MDAFFIKRILNLAWKPTLKMWAVATIPTALVANILVFKVGIPPPISNDFGFRFSQGVAYGLFDFAMRAIIMRLMFKIRLNNVQYALFLGLCLAINILHVFVQVYTAR